MGDNTSPISVILVSSGSRGNKLLFRYPFQRSQEHPASQTSKERDRQECEQERARERGRHRIRSRLQALSCHHRVQHGARTHKPGNHDLSQSQMLNPLSHPEWLHQLAFPPAAQKRSSFSTSS
uniref:NPR3 like, GATOR1 complex subunit n=1 Tax=Felis catus TaxID=9685 RepID=A0ABI7WN04_FELCA